MHTEVGPGGKYKTCMEFNGEPLLVSHKWSLLSFHQLFLLPKERKVEGSIVFQLCHH